MFDVKRLKRLYASLICVAIVSRWLRMIQGFSCRKTRALAAEGVCDKQFQSFRAQAEKRLRILEAAETLQDLKQLRSNRLEVLRGDKESFFSIRISKKWRICFTWKDGEPGPNNVSIVDYH
jgi:toxin HigB-1